MYGFFASAFKVLKAKAKTISFAKNQYGYQKPPNFLMISNSLMPDDPIKSYRHKTNRILKVYSSHSNWGTRLVSFDPMLKSRCPASFKKIF
jgi:hypothetical protein